MPKEINSCKCCGQKLEKRTGQQNRALHLWFSLLADSLNSAGFDMRATIKQDLDIPWNALTIKEYLWRPLQKIYLREQSTTRLKTKDLDKIYDIIVREIGGRTGIDVPPFPSLDTLYEISQNSAPSKRAGVKDNKLLF